jgi:hypothetical protein
VSLGQVRTLAPDGTRLRYLGAAGPVSGLAYSFTVPGGCEQMSCNLQADPMQRTDALDPGRITQVLLGADVVWEGILDEPQQGSQGWTVTAHGSGTWGSDWTAQYSSWPADAPDAIVNNAIGRGLGWQTSAMGQPSGIFLGQQPDSGSMQVDDMLNQLCSLGGLTWQVRRTPSGNIPQMFALPATPNRLLVATAPAPRTLGGDINAVVIRYCNTPDLGSGYPATFALTTATDAASIAKHGRKETYLDLSSAGAMTPSNAQQVGTYVLQRYQRASFAGPFTALRGQLLTLGGQPCDLGCFYFASEGPMVCKLLLTDQGWGGEVTPGPVIFLVGRYEWDEDSETATITPFQSMADDFASLLAMRASQAKRREIDVWKGSSALMWEFRGSGIGHKRYKGGHPPFRPFRPGSGHGGAA